MVLAERSGSWHQELSLDTLWRELNESCWFSLLAQGRHVSLRSGPFLPGGRRRRWSTAAWLLQGRMGFAINRSDRSIIFLTVLGALGLAK